MFFYFGELKVLLSLFFRDFWIKLGDLLLLPILRKKIENIFSRIPVLRDNTLQVNILIVLAVFTYIVITVDLQTEMAVEKDEISTLTGVLVQTFNLSLIDVPFGTTIDFPLLGYIPATSIQYDHSDIYTCLKARAPPAGQI